VIAAAGILYITPQPEPQVLLLRRTAVGGDFPNTWALPGGRIEDGEDAEQAAVREAREEMGEHPSGALEPWMRRTQQGVDYTTFLCRVAEPFEPTLNEEHDAYRWVPVSDLRELWSTK
jgi:8-oxo-dGTP pyrophosphatase MutT (NUDIX family)